MGLAIVRDHLYKLVSQRAMRLVGRKHLYPLHYWKAFDLLASARKRRINVVPNPDFFPLAQRNYYGLNNVIGHRDKP